MHIMSANARFVCQSLTPSSSVSKVLLGGLMRTAASGKKLKMMMTKGKEEVAFGN